MKFGVRNSADTMSQLRHSGWQYQKGKMGNGPGAGAGEREQQQLLRPQNGAQSSAGQVPGNSCWVLGTAAELWEWGWPGCREGLEPDSQRGEGNSC